MRKKIHLQHDLNMKKEMRMMKMRNLDEDLAFAAESFCHNDDVEKCNDDEAQRVEAKQDTSVAQRDCPQSAHLDKPQGQEKWKKTTKNSLNKRIA